MTKEPRVRKGGKRKMTVSTTERKDQKRKGQDLLGEWERESAANGKRKLATEKKRRDRCSFGGKRGRWRKSSTYEIVEKVKLGQRGNCLSQRKSSRSKKKTHVLIT